MSGEYRVADMLPRALRAPEPHMPMHTYMCAHTRTCTCTHTCRYAQQCAGLTYGGEGHKSLDEKAGGRGELVGFLNQDIKAHLRERKQRKHTVRCDSQLWEEAGSRREERSDGRRLPLQLSPDPRLQNGSVTV